MDQVANIKDILDAIRAVRLRANEAKMIGDTEKLSSLMMDLLALEQCLVYQAEELVKAA